MAKRCEVCRRNGDRKLKEYKGKQTCTECIEEMEAGGEPEEAYGPGEGPFHWAFDGTIDK